MFRLSNVRIRSNQLKVKYILIIIIIIIIIISEYKYALPGYSIWTNIFVCRINRISIDQYNIVKIYYNLLVKPSSKF